MPETILSSTNPYARFLPPNPDYLALLKATPITVESLIGRLSNDQLSQPPAPGKWSAAQILAHLADCEIAFAFRLRQTLAEDNHTIQPFDQDRWAVPYPSIPDLAAQSLATYKALRHWNLLLLEATYPAAGSKPAFHPERGVMTFQTIVETIAGHDLNHLAQLKALATP